MPHNPKPARRRAKKWSRKQQFAVIARYWRQGGHSSEYVAHRAHCSRTFVETCWGYLALEEDRRRAEDREADD